MWRHLLDLDLDLGKRDCGVRGIGMAVCVSVCGVYCKVTDGGVGGGDGDGGGDRVEMGVLDFRSGVIVVVKHFENTEHTSSMGKDLAELV